MATTKTFPSFSTNTTPASGDYLVGYYADGSTEFKATLDIISPFVGDTNENIRPVSYNNGVDGCHSTIGGGRINHVYGSCSVISGGAYNYVDGQAAAIGGGHANRATDEHAAIFAGAHNCANALNATVVGGYNNCALAPDTFIGAGKNNTASGYCSTISGGEGNYAGGGNATITGGSNNNAYGFGSTVSGKYNYIGGEGYGGTIAGGESNCISSYGGIGYQHVIGGGNENCIQYSEYQATISGGFRNSASGCYATIGGGSCNNVSCDNGTVSGGCCNSVCGSVSVIAGGCSNDNCGYHATISGGANNTITSGDYSSIVSGCQNVVNHDNSHVIGSEITTTSSNFTYVNNIQSLGAVNAAQGVPSGDSPTTGFSFGEDGDTGLFSPIVDGGSANGIVSLYANGQEVVKADQGGLTRLRLAGITYTLTRNGTTGALTLTPV